MRLYDVANGPGIRATLFVSGCTQNCKNCFNKEYQDFHYGDRFTKDNADALIAHLKAPQIVGLSILGGEPLQQDQTLLDFIKRVKKEVGKSIWLYT
ncbi:MAG: 4Fe-4S single cluster domain-containing protein, partial [Cellulosilyticaceae bacterium]